MGDPKKPKKTYEKPRKVWDKERIEKEHELKKRYGLKNTKELWKAKTFIRKKRKSARDLLALPLEERIKKEKELIESLSKIGLLSKTATLDEALTLDIEDILERRLQTLVWRKNLALTPKQARQLIVHGHIKLNNRIVTSPSYIVPKHLENTINYAKEKIVLKPAKKQKTELKKKFEEALPKNEIEEKIKEDNI